MKYVQPWKDVLAAFINGQSVRTADNSDGQSSLKSEGYSDGVCRLWSYRSPLAVLAYVVGLGNVVLINRQLVGYSATTQKHLSNLQSQCRMSDRVCLVLPFPANTGRNVDGHHTSASFGYDNRLGDANSRFPTLGECTELYNRWQPIDYQLIDHGIDGSQYFQGCGVSGTDYANVQTGCGMTPAEAIEDALEGIASSGVNLNTDKLEEQILSDNGWKHFPLRPKVSAKSEDMFYYVSIRFNATVNPTETTSNNV